MAKERMKRTTSKKSNSRAAERTHFLQLAYDTQAQEQHTFDQAHPKQKRVHLLPRTLNQETFINELENDDKNIVFALGPAGSGKTLLATMFAIRELKEGRIGKIVITRPAVSVDEDHGFLPGDLLEKMAPWVIPIMDVFKEYYHPHQIKHLLEDEKIEIAPLAYMRGRTLKNSIILGDELQNCTPSQMKMFLTRIGEGSKIIATGDINQHDRGFEKNGLKDFIERLEGSPTRSERMSVVRFEMVDVQRHAVIEDVLTMYGDDIS